MTAMANMGNFIVALPPSDNWLSDEQAADYLGYAFYLSLICMIALFSLIPIFLWKRSTNFD